MAKPAAITTCVDCAWFMPTAAGFGNCHRKSPVFDTGKGATSGIYPIVIAATDWCAEFVHTL